MDLSTNQNGSAPGESVIKTDGPRAAGRGMGIRWDWKQADDGDRAVLTVQADGPVTLRRILPLLESLDIEALDEQATVPDIEGADTAAQYSYRFTVTAGPAAQPAMARGDIAGSVIPAFDAMWSGLADADNYNALILAAGMSWRQVAVLRALGHYLGQTRLPYGQSRIQQVLVDHPQASGALIKLFEMRFGDPQIAADDIDRAVRAAEASVQLRDYIQQVVSLDADRVLRAFASVIEAIVRTNAYLGDALTENRPWLSFKLQPDQVEELPDPKPHFEIFVYSPTVEGVHLRFGPVSRGGVRWSDRLDDYRTEVLGLVKAQAVKNAVIVPAGAKGVFVPKPSATSSRVGQHGSAVAQNAAGIQGYRQFIGGLLDLTDNRVSAVETEPPASVVCHDAPDAYLVVAADKGTARFSDVANEIAIQRGFWLGDAFASGGSSGYDHKALGITARGAWVSAQQHLLELGLDVDRDDFTAVGVGDMSGDVFGNGMLLSPHLGLIAAFDHRHIFCDPNPDRQRAFSERKRLFDLPGSAWSDYDTDLISAGGGVWSRRVKTIPVTSPVREVLAIPGDVKALTPDQFISAILCAPVDLLWNGGIGTYIKAQHEQNSDIGDKFNDSVRVDAPNVRARVIVEGGNLGVSPQARIEIAERGALINSDAIDNAAGVDCSDHEVNIKIALDTLPADTLASQQRIDLLATMSDDVSALVLANNRDQGLVLSSARFESARMVGVHADMVADLEERNGLRRKLENLPTAEDFDELAQRGEGLVAPQLATLLAHVKLDLKKQLGNTDLFDDVYFTPILRAYFPSLLRARYAPIIDAHPLRREILGTVVVNNMVAVGGLTYAHRLADDTGAATCDVVRAYQVAADIFAIPAMLSDIQSCGLPVQLVNELSTEARRLLDRASRWLLNNRPQPLDVAAEIVRFKDAIAHLKPQVFGFLRGSEAETVTSAINGYLEQGVPEVHARTISESLYVFSLLDIVEAAHIDVDCSAAHLAETYFALSDHLGVDELLLAVSALPRSDRWHAQARLALREDLYRSLKSLTLDVVSRAAGGGEATCEEITTWEGANRSRLRRSRRSLEEMHSRAPHNLAALTVAATHIRRMTTPAPQQSSVIR